MDILQNLALMMYVLDKSPEMEDRMLKIYQHTAGVKFI